MFIVRPVFKCSCCGGLGIQIVEAEPLTESTIPSDDYNVEFDQNSSLVYLSPKDTSLDRFYFNRFTSFQCIRCRSLNIKIGTSIQELVGFSCESK